jgi:hypothetical protein
MGIVPVQKVGFILGATIPLPSEVVNTFNEISWDGFFYPIRSIR